MNQRQIGGTSVEVGDSGFGAAQIGNLYAEVDDETATQAVDAAWTAGLRYFDTAPHYGLGLSECRLGAAVWPGDLGRSSWCPPRRDGSSCPTRRRPAPTWQTEASPSPIC